MGKKLFVQIFYLHIMIYTRHKPYSCLVVWWLISLCIVYENINTWLSHKKILWTYFSIVFIFIFSTLHTTYLPIFDVLLLYQSEKIIPSLFLPFFWPPVAKSEATTYLHYYAVLWLQYAGSFLSFIGKCRRPISFF